VHDRHNALHLHSRQSHRHVSLFAIFLTRERTLTRPAAACRTAARPAQREGVVCRKN
jgi:hypothetical protein